jgi:hypothetical protein
MKKAVVIFAIIISAGTAGAWTFSGVNQMTLWSSQPGSKMDYRAHCDLRLAGEAGKDVSLEAGLRFLTDQENWDDQPMFTGFSKRYLQVKKDYMTARVGTYYSTLGRGLVLNCANELGAKIDRDLEGATAAVSLDNIGDARFLMGRIRENTREIDTSKTYVGGEIKLNRLAFAVVGGTYLRGNAAGPSGSASMGKPVDEIYSGNLSSTVGPVEFYGEYAGRRTYGQLFSSSSWAGVTDINGHAFYGSLTAAFTGVGLFADYKKYRNFTTGINAPPPVNREGRLLNSGSDEYGYQAEVTVSPWKSLELKGNYSWAATEDPADDVTAVDGTVFSGDLEWKDIFGEARWEASENYLVTAEARLRQEDFFQPDIVVKKYKGGSAGLVWKYSPGRSLSVKGGANLFNNIYLTETREVENLDYNEALVELGWVPLEWLNVFASGSASDKKLAEYDNERKWGEVGCTADYGGGKQQLKLSMGQTKGGLVCSGGFCRWEPAFRGFKAVWSWKF